MGEFSPIHWLIVLAIIVILFVGKRSDDFWRNLRGGSGPRGPGSQPPTHPLPVTGPIETAKPKRPDSEH